VVVSGTLPGGEAFAWGFWLDQAPVDNTVAQAACDTIAGYFETYLRDTAKGFLEADCAYTAVTLYGYNTATGPSDTQAASAIASGTGTATEASLPLQVGVVVSLHTNRPGRRGRGRMYLPINGVDLTAHQFVQGDIDTIIGDVDLFFTNINNSATINGVVSVLSQVDALIYPVVSVSADSRLDIQRRRAASEAALYDSTAAI
jgi:hypothetical protein